MTDFDLKTAVTIKTPSLKLEAPEALGITGSCAALGNWDKALIMETGKSIYASVCFEANASFEYKFVIADKDTGTILSWEYGDNRAADLPSKKGSRLKITASPARLDASPWRGAGTAIPVFSLRSEDSFGIGEFNDVKKLVDWAHLTGQKILQFLPVNDTTMTGRKEDSYPYNAVSAFALHPQFIHLPAIGAVEDEEFKKAKDELNALPAVDYERVNAVKTRIARKAFEDHGSATLRSKDYAQFMEANKWWLLPYAAFRLLTDLNGTAVFSQWGDNAVCSPAVIESLYAAHKKEIDFHCFMQYHLHKQFTEVKAYAHRHGVMLKGDLPIGISPTSCDAWLSPELFNLDCRAGAPPDFFSSLGQDWGFPTYNWEKMSEDGYLWWKARLGMMAEYFDAFRIDHILGFFRIWEIPGHAAHGILGHFNPAMPYSAKELKALGFDPKKHTVPPVEAIPEICGAQAEKIMTACVKNGRLLPRFSTQEKVVSALCGKENEELREALCYLLDDALFVEDGRKKGMYHPRIGGQATVSYKLLDPALQGIYNDLHEDFFYRRHDDFWRESAMSKLPSMLAATDMLPCGEDLGMIPACVPEVMDKLQILSMALETMPKHFGEAFAKVSEFPYMSVCTTSTHDMSPLRAWWEEDRSASARYYRECLGRGDGAPYFYEPWTCEQILRNNLSSPSMLTIFPFADWLSMDGDNRRTMPSEERINIPSIRRHNWNYRMHITLEKLLSLNDFNGRLRDMVKKSGR